MRIFKAITDPIIKAIVGASNAATANMDIIKEEIVHELDKSLSQRVVFETSANGRNVMLIAAVKENTAALSQFLRLNEIFIKSMTKYFELEIKEMEKRTATPALEPTEHDKLY
jgi:hypothetical protein